MMNTAIILRQTAGRFFLRSSSSSILGNNNYYYGCGIHSPATFAETMMTTTTTTKTTTNKTSSSSFNGLQQRCQRSLSTATATDEKPIIPGIGKGKTSTGLVGLAVEPDWYNVMLTKFQLLLDTMEDSDMPETCAYRMNVTKWANFVIATVKANPDDPEAVEDEVRMGQVEELIEMADDEMICMRMYIKEKFWLELDPEGPEIDFNPDPLKDELGPESDERTRQQILQDMERMKTWVDEEEDGDEYEPDHEGI